MYLCVRVCAVGLFLPKFSSLIEIIVAFLWLSLSSLSPCQCPLPFTCSLFYFLAKTCSSFPLIRHAQSESIDAGIKFVK